jgi:hypothetical protein
MQTISISESPISIAGLFVVVILLTAPGVHDSLFIYKKRLPCAGCSSSIQLERSDA